MWKEICGGAEIELGCILMGQHLPTKFTRNLLLHEGICRWERISFILGDVTRMNTHI